MSVETPTFDVDRATDVLNKAAEHLMYERTADGKAVLPESDADKIMEAERIVAMAEQARQVAEAAGKEKVAHYDAVMEVLFVAQVVGGSSTDGMAAADPVPEPVKEPQAAVGPPIGEEWVDDHATPWIIKGAVDQAGNIEVSMTSSPDEVTTIPLTSLKTRTKVAPEPQPQSVEEQQPASEPESSDPEIPVDDDEGDPEYANLLESSEQIFVRAGLPLPTVIHDPPHMPEDLTGVPDEQRRKLHSQFNACSARAHFMQAIERQRKIDCKRLYNVALKPAMRTKREELGKDATVTEVKARAEEHPAVVKWLNRVERHSDHEDAYKTLFDIYTENVSVLSRDHTMASTEESGS